MSEEASGDLFERSWVEAALASVCENGGSELSSLVGVPVVLAVSETTEVDVSDAAPGDEPVIVVLSRGGGTPPVSIQLVLARTSAAQLVGLHQGKKLDELADAGKTSLDSDALAAVREVVETLVVALQQGLAEHCEVALEVKDALEVEEPASDPTWLIGTRFQRARLSLGIRGATEASFDILFPPGSETEDFAAEVGDGKIALVDEPPGSVDADVLSRLLSCSVEAIPVARLDVEGIEPLAGCDALLIPWDLSGRPGIDLLERLLAHDPPPEAALLMTHTEPTVAIVRAALLAGARSFVIEPFEAQEVLERCGLLSAARNSEAAPAEEAG